MAGSKPNPLILCGPSGSGKSTLLGELLKDFPDQFGFSVSHTTRKARHGEIHGVHYYFISREEMEQQVKDGKFIESAIFSGNMYGTSKEAVRQVQDQNKICVLDIDVQGVKQVKQTDLNAWYVFIKPPSLQALEDRLRSRKSESEESLAQRLKVATDELKYGTPKNFDKIIVNDNLEQAYTELKEFIVSNIFV